MALSDNLVFDYELDEASGNAIDSHGSNDLTESGGTIAAASGPGGSGASRDFEADDTEWFEHADNADFDRGDTDFSFEIWFNAESFVSFPVLFRKRTNGGGAGNNYALYYDAGLNRLTWDGDTGFQARWGSTLSTATWYQAVVWHDATNNEVGIVVNAGTPVTSAHSGGVGTGDGEFQVGASVNQGLYWDGLIARFRLWSRVITSAERTELYNSGNSRDYAYITGGAAPSTNTEFSARIDVPHHLVGPMALRQGWRPTPLRDFTQAPITSPVPALPPVILPHPHVGPMALRQGWRQPPPYNPTQAPAIDTQFGTRTDLPHHLVGPPALRQGWRPTPIQDLTQAPAVNYEFAPPLRVPHRFVGPPVLRLMAAQRAITYDTSAAPPATGNRIRRVICSGA